MALRVFDIMDANQTKITRNLEDGLCDLYLEPEMKGHSQYAIKDLDTIYNYGFFRSATVYSEQYRINGFKGKISENYRNYGRNRL